VPAVPQANLDTTVAALQHEAAVQAEGASAWDAKLMGILAFMAAVAGLLLTVDHALQSYRWILLVGAGGASLLVLIGLFIADDSESCPDPIDFYDRFGAAEPDDFLKQMIDDFRALQIHNRSCIEQRRGIASASFSLAVSAAVFFGLARVVVALLA
jgi:hypothetical protein